MASKLVLGKRRPENAGGGGPVNAGGGGPVNAGGGGLENAGGGGRENAGGGGPVNAGGGGGGGGAPAALIYPIDKPLFDAFCSVIESTRIKSGVCQAIIQQLQADKSHLQADICTDAALDLTPIVASDTHIAGNPVVKIGGGTYGTIFLDTENGKVYKRIKYNSDDTTEEEFHRELFMEAFIQTVLQNDPVYGKHIGQIVKVYKDSSVVKASNRPQTLTRDTQTYYDFSDSKPATYKRARFVPYYYYEMERINYTLESYYTEIHSGRLGPGIKPNHVMGSQFAHLGVILEHFKRTYGFQHRDLHSQNIMFALSGPKPASPPSSPANDPPEQSARRTGGGGIPRHAKFGPPSPMLPRGHHGDRAIAARAAGAAGGGSGGGGGSGPVGGNAQVDLHHIVKPDESYGELKIIDFGKSCIDLSGTTYSVDDKGCESYDLLILIASLLNHDMLRQLKPQFRELMEGQTAAPRYGIKNLYDILESERGTARMPPFHMTYKSYYMDLPTSIWRNPNVSLLLWFIQQIYEEKLTPAKFAEYWDKYVNPPPRVGGVGGGGGVLSWLGWGGVRKRRMGRTFAKKRFQRKKSQRGTRKYKTRR